MTTPREQLDAAHAFCFCNKACLSRSHAAGCFHCLKVFSAGDVTEFVKRDDQAAICPRCGTDSVVGDASHFPVTDTDWLRQMRERWFARIEPSPFAPRLCPVVAACDECGREAPNVVFDVEAAGSEENDNGEHHVCEPCLRAALALFEKRAEPVAAVALVWKQGQVLVVWNKRYNGWSLPGGKVEAGESSFEGLRRELREETSLDVVTATLVFSGPHNLKVESTRGSRVDLYFVDATGEPALVEEGCPVKWMRATQFITPSPETPFADFYKDVFIGLEDRVRVATLPAWVIGR